MIDFGIRTLTDVDIIGLPEARQPETGKQQAADQNGQKDSPFHIDLVKFYDQISSIPGKAAP
jgi:hypothetical protein